MTSKCAAGVLLIAAIATSQDPVPEPAPPSAAEVLRATLAATRVLASVAFDCRTTETQAVALPFGNHDRRLRLTGTSVAGQGTYVAIGSGDHELYLLHDRCVARRSGGDWVLRRGHLADGGALPFVPDLLALCVGLAPLAAQAEWKDAGAGGEPRDLVVTATGSAARELMWSGALPAPAANLQSLVAALEVPGAAVAPPQVRYEVTLSVDPAAQRLLAVHARGWRLADDPAGVQVVFDVADPDAARRVEAARGRPDDDERAAVELRLTLSDHDAARLQVPAAVQALLGAGPAPPPAAGK